MTIRVTHSVKRVQDRAPHTERRTRLEVGDLKTRGSLRTLFLTPQLVEMLRRTRTTPLKPRLPLSSAPLAPRPAPTAVIRDPLPGDDTGSWTGFVLVRSRLGVARL